ncbi:hypothetical protein AMK23_34620 [Streptomyces sp. CB02130]|uniref:hypothetical protein n=1 Tax=Streptomyces sp. CB02130 TaxID=1703934 RepID=UPI00093E914D|nr:hypothetical protein [Streptomyces sp. CB02130]OKJ19416.1 hypothetical protein AMK23_34620 [Streptomyces sp. CB02130]
MDFIAVVWSDKTTPDRADRARKAWALYQSENGVEAENRIEDLISDLLHLAEVDEHPGGAEGVAARASRNYEAETGTWPEGWVKAEHPGRFVAQVRQAGGVWFTVGDGDDPRTVAGFLWKAMQIAGFRFSELAAHSEDLMQGRVLTSNDGFEFRVIPRDES